MRIVRSAWLLSVFRYRNTDNNQAERDLRPHKTPQKISGRLTSEATTRDRLAIRGFLSTAIKHGHDAMTTIREAILGDPWIPPIPADP